VAPGQSVLIFHRYPTSILFTIAVHLNDWKERSRLITPPPENSFIFKAAVKKFIDKPASSHGNQAPHECFCIALYAEDNNP